MSPAVYEGQPAGRRRPRTAQTAASPAARAVAAVAQDRGDRRCASWRSSRWRGSWSWRSRLRPRPAERHQPQRLGLTARRLVPAVDGFAGSPTAQETVEHGSWTSARRPVEWVECTPADDDESRAAPGRPAMARRPRVAIERGSLDATASRHARRHDRDRRRVHRRVTESGQRRRRLQRLRGDWSKTVRFARQRPSSPGEFNSHSTQLGDARRLDRHDRSSVTPRSPSTARPRPGQLERPLTADPLAARGPWAPPGRLFARRLAGDGPDDPRHQLRRPAGGGRRQPGQRLDELQDVLVGEARRAGRRAGARSRPRSRRAAAAPLQLARLELRDEPDRPIEQPDEHDERRQPVAQRGELGVVRVGRGGVGGLGAFCSMTSTIGSPSRTLRSAMTLPNHCQWSPTAR